MCKVRFIPFTWLFLLVIGAGQANAALLTEDWKIAGDGLVTRDSSTGLGWLRLTETNGLSRNFVLSELGAGGLFDGFRYATTQEVIDLWSNFSIDLSIGAATSGPGLDPGVVTATGHLGNTYCEFNCTTLLYGVEGLTGDPFPAASSVQPIMGAYSFHSYTEFKTIEHGNGLISILNESVSMSTGHYLVATAVPLPQALWLFIGGFIMLSRVMGRRRN